MTAPPYSPRTVVDGTPYFPEPYSLNPLPDDLQTGLIPVGVLALLSVLSTLVLITFIIFRMATWKLHYRTFLGYNQYVILVLNLLIADLQQSSAFLISFHWIRTGMILAPSSPCFAQAWLLHSGDVSSGFFVLAIALHTFYTAVHGKRVGQKTFATTVFCIWLFSYFLTGLGVGLHGEKYFVRAGAWCWVSEAYESDRLALHYIWVFLVQFGTVVIYIITFFMLRHKTRQLFALHAATGDRGNGPNIATIKSVNRITKLMTLYPCVYVLLTLPLSAGRMWSMAHHATPYSNAYACVAGAMITSCGWVDSLLYTLTRRKLLRDTMPNAGSSARRTRGSDWDNELGSKGITHTRTVTVEGGQVMDTLAPKDRDYARPPSHPSHSHNVSSATWERPASPTGSIDPILSGRVTPAMKKEAEVGTSEKMKEDPEKSDQITALPKGWVRHRDR
ncbi:uncharacterized protein LTR77_009941 [Saxophila tyrrhenica]|uniref:G protein-coupled receptor GPR1/2/3 C-terminal domain-containing protein n=1 Tax=Saxophila tyrrhenica TaxID=1690608 RepID=A0AAV9NWG7_9PEZI|nr:hypothetical protein LTR77_009941 [Saxophila tyrrhenica]